MVASNLHLRAPLGVFMVSIPFIAGQWSLPASSTKIEPTLVKFQSPSLRGSGRFRSSEARLLEDLKVSIPFIAGQWSLRTAWRDGSFSKTCFNPLHCGAVVASNLRDLGGLIGDLFQSPSLRGSGRFVCISALPAAGGRVSIPFIAGQWSLPAVWQGGRDLARVSIPFIAGQWSLRI